MVAASSGGTLLLVSPAAHRWSRTLEQHSRLEVKQFLDGDSYLRVRESVEDRRVTILHAGYPDQDRAMIQLLLTVRHLKEHGSEHIRAVVPYLPYSRKTKAFLAGEVLNTQILCRLLKTSGCDELVTFDCHFLKTPGLHRFEGLTIRNLTMAPAILSRLKRGVSHPLVVAPDQGAEGLLGGEGEYVVLRKRRGAYVRGSVSRKPAVEMDFDAEGRDVVLIDDIISTGQTMLSAIQACRRAGARSFVGGATHGFFHDGAAAALHEAGMTRILNSNTIVSPQAKVSIASELRKAIHHDPGREPRVEG